MKYHTDIDTFLAKYPFVQYLLLALITLVAVALRFYKLDEWSFWGDEMYTIRDSAKVFELGLMSQKPSRLATYFILNYFGVNEWSARLFPALIGAISVPILYFPVKKIFGSSAALIAILLLAVSPWHLYWSQNARFYTPLLLFYTLALLTFYLAFEEDHLGYLCLSMLFLGLAAWEHLTALILGPIAVCFLGLVWILPFEKPAGLRLRNLLVFLLPGIIGGLYFILPILRNPQRWFVDYFGYVNNNPFWILAGVVYYVGIPVICIGALGAICLLIEKNRAALLLGLSAIVPLLAIMMMALVLFSANRYVFVSLTSWIILAGVAAKELFTRTRGLGKILAGGVLTILLLMPLSDNMLYYKYQHGNRDNWKAAFNWLKENKQETDLIVVPHKLVADYYLKDRSTAMGRVDVNQLQAEKQRVWFVEDMMVESKYPQLYSWMRENTHLMTNFDNHVLARNFKMRIHLYEPDQPNNDLATK